MSEISLINMVLLLEKRLEIEEEQRIKRVGPRAQSHIDEAHIWHRVQAVIIRRLSRSGKHKKIVDDYDRENCCIEPVFSKRT